MPLSPSYPFDANFSRNLEYWLPSIFSQTISMTDLFVSFCRPSSPLLETELQRSATYEHELKGLEVRPSSSRHSSAVRCRRSAQEKLLEGLSNCRALEGIIRQSFTSIKVRPSPLPSPGSTRHRHLLTPEVSPAKLSSCRPRHAAHERPSDRR